MTDGHNGVKREAHPEPSAGAKLTDRGRSDVYSCKQDVLIVYET
jgi:hypothetical protein